MSDFYTILTAAGAAKFTNHLSLGTPVNLTSFAVGDGKANDTDPEDYVSYSPDGSETALRNQKYSGNINSIAVDPNDDTVLTIQGVVPAAQGGWWISEVGIFDDQNVLIAIVKAPPSLKPDPNSGAASDFNIRTHMKVSSAAAAQLVVDPAIALASHEYVDQKIAALGGGSISDISGLQDALDAKAAIDHNHDDVYRKLSDNVGHGQCRLSLDGADLKLSPFNGNKLIVGGTDHTLPPAGVALSSTGLLADTTYYIYAYMSGDPLAIALEASTTGHSTHTDGVEIKTGDETRTLVGMARTDSTANWVDNATQIFVLSWFNRRPKKGVNTYTLDRSTSSLSLVELHPEIRVEFLTWGEVTANSNGTGHASANYLHTYHLSIDGTINDKWIYMRQATMGTYVSEVLGPRHSTETEGLHFVTIFVSVNAGSVTLKASATTTQSKKTYLHIEVQG